MKRILALCLSLCLLLGGCSSLGESNKENPIKLTLWHYYNGPAKETFDSLIQSYNETAGAKAGILIDATNFSGVDNLADSVASSAKGEAGSPELPDIFAAYPDTLYQLNELSLVTALDSYFTESELALYQQDFVNSGRFGSDNKLHILPIAKSTELFYLNVTDFEPFATACHLTDTSLNTWENLAKTAKLYYDWTDAKTPTPNDGKAFFGIDSFANFFLVATRQLGGDLYDGDNVRFSFDRATAKKVWDYLYAPYLSGYYTSLGRFRSDDTKSGDLIAYVGSTASANYFPTQVEVAKDQSYPIDCRVYPYPVFADGTAVVVQQGAGLAVTKSNEERQKAAVHFLKWFTQPEQNTAFALSTGYIPVQTDAFSKDAILKALAAQPDQDLDSPSAQTALLSESLMETYSLYAPRPFTGSYDARKRLDSTLTTRLAADQQRLETMLASGQSKEAALADLLSEENFDNWYTNFVQEMTVIVK